MSLDNFARQIMPQKNPVSKQNFQAQGYVDNAVHKVVNTRELTVTKNRRWILNPYYARSLTSQTATVGRVHLGQVEVLFNTIVDGVAIYNFATVAGSVTVGIYNSVADDTPAGGSVVAESASTLCAGASQMQVVTFPSPVKLTPGIYYIASQFSNVTHTFSRYANSMWIPSWNNYYDRGGGYGALTNPCPAITQSGNGQPMVALRVSG